MRKGLRQLGQVRPNSDVIQLAYTSFKGLETTVMNVVICNTSDLAATFSICLDIDSSIFDESTAIHWEQPIPAKSTVTLEKDLFMDHNATGYIGVQSSVPDAITFTINGKEEV